MLTLKDLSVSYNDFKALNINGTITVNKGDRIGLIGSNGAGKSTFIKACLGLIPSEGTIKSESRNQDMAVHMQHNDYVDTMKTEYILKYLLNTDIKGNEKLEALISFFDFEPSLKKKYKQLSGGQKQRFTLILVMYQDAPITFFDEVTSGLDFETRQSLITKIKSWYDRKNAALIFVTHYYEEIEHLANKIIILEQGKLVDFDDRETLFKRYCGYSIVTLDNTEQNRASTKDFTYIEGTQETLALSCANSTIEAEIIDTLVRENINFKRSNQDIEIMSINAIKAFKEAKNHA